MIRSADKAKARRKGKTNGRTKTDDSALRVAIAELGLTRSREVLAEVERAFGG